MKQNLYQILGVSEEASTEEIDARYKRLREKYENTPTEDAANALVLIREAKSTLDNPMSRTAYDASLRIPTGLVPAPTSARSAARLYVEVPTRIQPATYDEFDRPWVQRHRSSIVIFTLLAIAVFTAWSWRTDLDAKNRLERELVEAKAAQMAAESKIGQGRVANEAQLVGGLVANQSRALVNQDTANVRANEALDKRLQFERDAQERRYAHEQARLNSEREREAAQQRRAEPDRAEARAERRLEEIRRENRRLDEVLRSRNDTPLYRPHNASNF